MAFIVCYRKYRHHRNYPWQQFCETLEETKQFVDGLTGEYDYKVFMEIDHNYFEELLEGDDK